MTVERVCFPAGCDRDPCKSDEDCIDNTYCALGGPCSVLLPSPDLKCCHAGEQGDSCDEDWQCEKRGNYCYEPTRECFNGSSGDLCSSDSDCQPRDWQLEDNPDTTDGICVMNKCRKGDKNSYCEKDADCENGKCKADGGAHGNCN